jgi:hypothetical protein
LTASNGQPLAVGEVRIECPELCLFAPVNNERGGFDDSQLGRGCSLGCQLRAVSAGHRDFVAPASNYCVKRNGGLCTELEADIKLEPSAKR